MLVNDFDYAGPAEDFTVIENGRRRVVAGVPGDEEGSRCPFFSHVRKVNLRDKLTDRGPSSQFRLLRRGIPYGLPWSATETEPADRGLLFLSYQRDIEQFLTPSVNWMKQSSAPEGFGHDLLVGQTGGSREAARRNSDGIILFAPP
jgi:deferrochelatase/peroxidase EfeB